MDIVIPVGPGNGEDLRFALRSYAMHLPHRGVWLIGERRVDLPGTEQIYVPQDVERHANAKANLWAAIEDDRISDTFLYCNDDFFVMNPLGEVPLFHRGMMQSHIAKTRVLVGQSPYVAAMERTEMLLKEIGITRPISYEAHAPLVVSKAGLADALELCRTDPRLHERTIYGNLFNIGGKERDDVKFHHRSRGWKGEDLVSTRDEAFPQDWRIARQIRNRFPDASHYEEPPQVSVSLPAPEGYHDEKEAGR